jgi:agmatine/peptidylarginine deiminase
MKNSEKYRNYVPYPFWAMDQEFFFKYANDLTGDDRSQLGYYPFKWAYVPPHDSSTAAEFLRDIGVEADRVTAEAVTEKFENMTSFELLAQEGTVQWGGDILYDNPPPGFRMIPEWEPMSGVLLNWPTFYPPLWDMFRQMIAALDHVTTFLRIGEGYFGATVLAWLDAYGIDLDKIRPIPGPIGDSWARDYSPLYGVNIYSGEPVAHKFSFAAFWPEYRAKYRSIVEIDDNFVLKDGFRVYRSEIKLDGGAILTDGNGTYIITRRILRDNQDVINLYAKLEAWLGADRLLVVDEEPDDILGHINHFKFISPQKIIVGRPDKDGTKVHRYLEKISKLCEKSGYEVIRVPFSEGFDHRLPGGDNTHTALYANSLMMNKRILVATFDQEGLEKYNEDALAVYQQALPDYEVIPIEATIQTNAGGAINCSSKEVPDINRMREDFDSNR